jgi:hypothetical protein
VLALRWLVHHSKLDSDRDDAINRASETVRPHWPSYFVVL